MARASGGSTYEPTKRGGGAQKETIQMCLTFSLERN